MQDDVSIRPTRKRFIIVACLFVGIFIAYLDRVNVSVLAANDIFLTDMGIQGLPVQIGMMMSVFLAAYGIANVVLSPVGDYLGPRKSMILCIVLWTISLLIGGFATSFTLIIICRILLGVGEGFYYPLQSVFIKNWFPKQERGRANAAWIVGQSIAPAIAMPFFAYWIGTFGWRSNFFFCAVIGLIPLYLLWRHTADTPRQLKGISAAEIAHIEAGQEAPAVKSTESFWVRVKPFITNYHYWLLVLWYLCLQGMYWGLITWLPAYLKSARGFSWAEMGWLASLPFILSTFSKAMTGIISDKVGRNAPILMVAMCSAAICVYCGAVVENKYVSAVFLSLAVAFCTMGTPVAWTLLQGLIPGSSMSTAAGMMNGLANGLASLSPAFIGLFIMLTGGYTGGLLCLVVTGVVAIVAALILTIKKY
ncbi:MFS transporter [Zophobihabitans entericus]|uniref:MFS transporter n=1 Tax=Zophobihabitans entericus TaxID=1635327 RepID=A0A6G9ID00_9GAMM|nr:MFS transporter [Zophobihabitans entericus]QIQ22111.1 MFS transporter [Zophobihabitans entericus]